MCDVYRYRVKAPAGACQRTFGIERNVACRYNRRVARTPLALDTAPEIERRQLEGWRRMSPAEKAAIVSGLTQAAFDLALAGVRQRHPTASAREQFLRLALVTLGHGLARKVYPDIEELDLR